MFLTCATYRQAAWAPDNQWSTAWNSTTAVTSSNAVTAGLFTSKTGAGTTRIAYTFTVTRFTNSTNVATGSRQTVHGNPIASVISNVGVSFTNSQIIANAVQISNPDGSSSSWWQVYETFLTVSSKFQIVVTNLTGSSSVSSSGATAFTTLSLNLLGFVGGSASVIPGSTSTASSQSVITSTQGVSTFSTTARPSVASVVTTTTATNVPGTSTTTSTNTFSLWSVAGTRIFRTTATTTTVGFSGTTVAFTAATTISFSVATPSWWGWSMETGTLLLATGNWGIAELPCWLEMSNYTGTLAALWHFSTATQTTLWPAQPIGSVQGIGGTSSTSAFSSIFQLWTTIVTLPGTATVTTTTSQSAAGTFGTSGSDGVFGALNPVPSFAQTVTSFLTFTFTTSTIFQTPINTSTFITNDTTNYAPAILTFIISNIAAAQFIATSYTLTTVQSGSTTVNVVTAITDSANSAISSQSTATLALTNVSVTTTTATDSWFLDWSCPTQLASSSTGITITSSTSPSISVTSVTAIGQTHGFTQNLFAAPYPVLAPMQTFNDVFGNLSVVPGVYRSYAPQPPAQAFANWTATGSPFYSLNAPAAVTAMLLQAIISGRPIGFDVAGYPITSAQSALWALVANPLTKLNVVGTKTFTQLAGYTYSSLHSAAGISTTISVAFPANMDAAAASISVSTANSSTGGLSVYGGFSFGGANTGTFPAAAGFTSVQLQSTTFTSTSTFLSGGTTQSQILLSTTATTFTVTVNSNSTCRSQYVPGPGGAGYGGAAVTLVGINAAISLQGSTSSFSVASLNFFEIVIGGTFAASSRSGNSFTFPGAASVFTSPVWLISTGQNRFVPALTTFTNFWVQPDPFLVPLNGLR